MGIVGLVFNNLGEIALMILTGFACYNIGAWKQKRFPNVKLAPWAWFRKA